MSDRYCIASNATKHFRFSSEELVSCCMLCGMGCNGGFPGSAWRYWVSKGLVSGGPYDSNQVNSSSKHPLNLLFLFLFQ